MREFSHVVPIEQLGARAETVHLKAGASAREALARRFDLLALDRLEAKLRLWRIDGGAEVEGDLVADAVQRCVASGEPVPVHVEERVRLRFLDLPDSGEEVELGAEDLDVMALEEGGLDLGEAMAQSLALALPAYPRCADATVSGLMSEEEAEALRARSSPFSVLKQR